MNTNEDFNHLRVPEIKLSFWQVLSKELYIENRFFYPIKKIILKNFLLRKLALKGKNFLISLFFLDMSKETIEKSIKQLKADRTNHSDSATEMGSGYGYDTEIVEFQTVVKYYSQVKSEDLKQSESGILYDNIHSKASSLFKTDRSIKNFVNMGVSYAHIDSQLAKAHPHINFIGIDRSDLTKTFNEALFKDLSNLSFVTSDIFEYLKGKSFKSDVFFLARTLIYLPKSFVKKLYKEVHATGFEYILGFEQVGISRETMKPYDFSYQDQNSVAFRSGMIIHNYPALLKENGFKIIESELIKTNHPNDDFRILYYLAKRVD